MMSFAEIEKSILKVTGSSRNAPLSPSQNDLKKMKSEVSYFLI